MAAIKSKEEIKRLFGNRFGRSNESIRNHKLGSYVTIDFSSANLKKHGLRPLRRWSDDIDLCIVHIFEHNKSVVGMTGSMEIVEVPVCLLPLI